MKIATENRAEKEKRWQERLEAANVHPGGLAAYCRENQVSRSALDYWRKKIRKATLQRLNQPRPFIPIEVLEAELRIANKPVLPDAKWVAEVILHLCAGMTGGSQ